MQRGPAAQRYERRSALRTHVERRDLRLQHDEPRIGNGVEVQRASDVQERQVSNVSAGIRRESRGFEHSPDRKVRIAERKRNRTPLRIGEDDVLLSRLIGKYRAGFGQEASQAVVVRGDRERISVQLRMFEDQVRPGEPEIIVGADRLRAERDAACDRERDGERGCLTSSDA